MGVTEIARSRTGPGGRRRAYAAALSAAAVSVVVAVTGAALSWPERPFPGWAWAPAHLAGASFAIAGAVLWIRRPGNPSGRLMVLVGITWYIGDLQFSDHPWLFAVGFCFYYLSSQALAHLVLALPTGRLANRRERALIATQYVLGPATQVPRYFTEDPREHQMWGDIGATYSIWADIGAVANIACAVLLAALILRRWAGVGWVVRRGYAAVWAVALGIAMVAILTSVGFLTRHAPQPEPLLAFSIGLVLLPVGIAVGLLRVRLARTRVADLVIRLATAAQPERVRAALADALDDPMLDLYFRLPHGGYVDVRGRPVAAPAADGRAHTRIERDGGELALLVHDPTVAEPELVTAVVAAARLALENARLHASQRTQLAQARASRARLVAAADVERRRIQRDLHDGAQHKLLAASMLLEQARVASRGDAAPATNRHGGPAGLIELASAHLREATRELRELTEAIYPPALAEQGLAAAVEALAERAPLRVGTAIPAGRLPEAVERTAYFMITEALTNVYKHARAGTVWVRVSRREHAVVVEVTDDGSGGADPSRGTGLRGLEDRIAAHGGTLRVDSPPGAGTRLVAELPCA